MSTPTPLSLYDFTVPTLINSLTALSNILTKASTGPKSSDLGADPTTIRLIDDMRPLTFQIQTACDTAKFTCVRVGNGVEDVVFEDTEKSWDDMQERIAKTLEFLKKVDRKVFEGTEGKEVMFRDYKFTGLSYVTKFAMPNFFFHVSAAYCILRARGVDVGKLDYLGAIRDQKEY